MSQGSLTAMLTKHSIGNALFHSANDIVTRRVAISIKFESRRSVTFQTRQACVSTGWYFGGGRVAMRMKPKARWSGNGEGGIGA